MIDHAAFLEVAWLCDSPTPLLICPQSPTNMENYFALKKKKKINGWWGRKIGYEVSFFQETDSDEKGPSSGQE